MLAASRRAFLLPVKPFLATCSSPATAAMSYSAAASQGGSNNDPSSTTTHSSPDKQIRRSGASGHGEHSAPRHKRSPSPAHVPVTETEDESVYVLTLLTDPQLHKHLTAIRDKYFPRRINKLGAHLTLFHALPGSRLHDHILPTIQDVASQTSRFKVHAVKPFRLKHGIAISVAKNSGTSQAQELHHALQQPWLKAGFLSDQDQGGCRIHYTVMNKVDDEQEIEAAMEELQQDFRGDWGVAEGLGLWRYDKGFWRWQRRFDFKSEANDQA